MAEGGAGPCGQVPLPTADVRAAIDDRDRDRPTVGRIAEGDARTTWEGAIGHAEERLGHRHAAGGSLAVEARSVPTDVPVEAPRWHHDDPARRLGLDDRVGRAANGRRQRVRVEKDRGGVQRTV